VLDAVNQIADGMEKKPKDVYGMCCIETDEEVGVKQIPSI
jgi:26S proteasome regulatory subunit (ATPase 3-interacting protein)